MEPGVFKTGLEEIRALRVLFLQENNFQFICNKCHDYGWADTYLFMLDGIKIGYGAVWGQSNRADRDAIFEFYLIPPFRKLSSLVFSTFILTSGAIFIEAQTNDALLSQMLYEFADNIQAESILFEDHYTSSLSIPGTVFRPRTSADNMSDSDGDHVLGQQDEIVAHGGLMLNYNIPFADIYMHVKEPFRGRGLGSLIVQELKGLAYNMGRVPAARCNINNQISKATLLKAGLKICGFRVQGDIKKL